MYLSCNAQGTFAFGGFFCEKVSSGGLSENDLTCASDLKCLFGPGMGLHFWHMSYFTVTPSGAFEQTKNLWNRSGIMPHKD